MLLAFLLSQALLAQDEGRVKALLADLGSDDASSRDAASTELAKLDAADETGQVERMIEAAAHGTDAEVTSRCRQLLDRFRYWVSLLVLCGGVVKRGDDDPADWVRGAIDVTTGEWAWKRHGRGGACAGTRERGAVAYLEPNEGGLECVDLRTGATKWHYEGAAQGVPVGTQRWVGYEGSQVVCISLPTGQVLWKTALGSRVDVLRPPPLAADDDAVYLITRAGLVALDGASGKLLWSREGREYAHLRLVHGGLYVSAEISVWPAFVRRIDRATGKDVWRFELANGEALGPVIGLADEKTAIVSSLVWPQGSTCAIDTDTGKARWTVHSPCSGAWCDLDARRLWLATPKVLLVVDEATGKEVWQEVYEGDSAAFLHEENRLYVATFHMQNWGVSMAAYDPSKPARVWKADVEGVLTPWGVCMQRVRIERLGTRLLLVDESSSGASVEVVDPETGKVTARFGEK